MQLRKYQREAVDSIYRYYEEYNGNALIVLPTGSGKSLVMATFIREVVTAWPDQSILMLTHVKELLEQNEKELLSIWEDAPVGVYSAGLKRRESGKGTYEQAITIGGIQSVCKKSDELGAFDLILIDECHLVPQGSEGQYRSFLNDQLKLNPKVKVIGFTATPYRMKQGLLTIGKDKLFDDVIYDKPVGELVMEGFLAPLVSKGGKIKVNLSGVSIRAGEYVTAELETAVDRITTTAVDEVIEVAASRKSWLVFCVTVEHAQSVRDEFQKKGIICEMIHGKTPAKERADLLAKFKKHEIRCITNVGVLTTGFNHPDLDCIVLLRPTMSTSLYVQMLGRGMRNAQGKSNCLILDYSGCVMTHGPIDGVRVQKNNIGGDAEVKTAPARECPECAALIHAAFLICPDCGHEFPVKENKTVSKASDAPVMKCIQDYDVDKVTYHLHQKIGTPPSVRVEYHCGIMNVFREWICVEHHGYARQRAYEWWIKRTNRAMPPLAEQAIEILKGSEIREPSSITIAFNGNYPEIKRYEFNDN